MKAGLNLWTYMESEKSGHLIGTAFGLCDLVENDTDSMLLKLVTPTSDDFIELVRDNLSEWYWASGLPVYDDSKMGKMTHLRSNIFLLILSMKNQL